MQFVKKILPTLEQDEGLQLETYNEIKRSFTPANVDFLLNKYIFNLIDKDQTVTGIPEAYKIVADYLKREKFGARKAVQLLSDNIKIKQLTKALDMLTDLADPTNMFNATILKI